MQLSTEIIIYLLVESFKFSEGTGDINWTVGPIVQPFVFDPSAGNRAQMPLVVTAVNAD